MADSSFDVVSDFDQQELVNALDQVRREVATRYDFKGAKVLAGARQGRDHAARRRRVPGRIGQGPDRDQGGAPWPVAEGLRLGQARAGGRRHGAAAHRAARGA